MIKLIRPKVSVSFENCKQFYHLPDYIYISFIRPLLDYTDVIQPSNAYSSKKIESVQYNAALAIMAAVKVSSSVRLYQELGLEYLYQRRCARRLCLNHKVFLNWSAILHL